MHSKTRNNDHMSKKEFINLVADELVEGFAIENNNGTLELKANSVKGISITIASLTADGVYHRYYTKSKK